MGTRGSSLNGGVRVHPNNYNKGDSTPARPPCPEGNPSSGSTRNGGSGDSVGERNTTNTTFVPSNRGKISPPSPTRLPGGGVDHASDNTGVQSEETGVAGTTPVVYRKRRPSLIRRSKSKLLNFWRRNSKGARDVFGYAPEEPGGGTSTSGSSDLSVGTSRLGARAEGDRRGDSRSWLSEMDCRRPASRCTSVGSDGDQHSFRMKRQPSTYGELHELVVKEKLGDGVVRGLGGLRNLGNTCFMNSALQCLANCEPLVDYFLGFDWQAEINRTNILGHKGLVAEAFGKLANEMWRSNDRFIAPYSFKGKVGEAMPLFAGYEQQDVQEFLAFLLDAVHEDLNRVPNAERKYIEAKEAKEGESEESVAMEAWKGYLERNRSIVVDLFQGQLRSALQCGVCGKRSVTFDPFMYLSVPLPEHPPPAGVAGDILGNKREKGGEAFAEISLGACIRMYCEVETLEGDNAWYCPSCKKRQPATKKLDLWKVPPVLIVHLKRFAGDAKICSPVSFPLTGLDLSEVVISPQKEPPDYDLFATANHSGSVHGGHYTAAAKNRVSGNWNCFDDTEVTRLEPSEVQAASAYVLFYSKMSTVEEAMEDTDVPMQGLKREGTVLMPVPPIASRTICASGNETTRVVSPKRATAVVRRQSVSKPYNWPHLQGEVDTKWKPAFEATPPSPTIAEEPHAPRHVTTREAQNLERTTAEQGFGEIRGEARNSEGGGVSLPEIARTPAEMNSSATGSASGNSTVGSSLPGDGLEGVPS